jgi:hypothetical protein
VYQSILSTTWLWFSLPASGCVPKLRDLCFFDRVTRRAGRVSSTLCDWNLCALGFAPPSPGLRHGGVPCDSRKSTSTPTGFEVTSKRRKGFPSETRVKRGARVVGGCKELTEKLGRNDPCPCFSGRRFQELLHAKRRVRRLRPSSFFSETDDVPGNRGRRSRGVVCFGPRVPVEYGGPAAPVWPRVTVLGQFWDSALMTLRDIK